VDARLRALPRLEDGDHLEMSNPQPTRRDLGRVFTAGLLSARIPLRADGSLTAREVMDRVKQHVGVPWNEKTYRDVFHAGDPDGVVHGIASTFMSSLDVFQRAHAKGLNFVISHEPTFWSDDDAIGPVRNDPLFKHKRTYIEQNGMMVFRLHDHWHARKPDGIFEGWNRTLGWDGYLVPGNNRMWDLPPATLGAIAQHVAKRLDTRSVRLVGDPALPVRRLARGGHTLSQNMAALPSVDALLVSEAREYDSIEYVRDVVLSGEKKGMILISHEAGEEAGMENFASWIRPFIPEVPVEFVPTRDQMWIPS
jgi:putative NIF3 family GTP cyclohydrolase 1 type 2